MPYRPYAPSSPLLIGYDPERDLPADHLARLVDQVVEAAVLPALKPVGRGQPAYDPRLPVKVLVYGYATGVRSSRQLERACRESLPYLYLTRGDAPSYGTLCSVRRDCKEQLEAVWVHLYAVAEEAGIRRLGKIVVDSTKIRANVSPEAVVKRDEFAAVREELARVLAEAEAADAKEAQEGSTETRTGEVVQTDRMREILRRVRKRLSASRRGEESAPPSEASEISEASVLGPRMKSRVKGAIETLKGAEEEGRKHACLSDPEARMMGEGREKKIRPCHSLEIVADNGLLVAAETTNIGTDNSRLTGLMEAARKNEPSGIVAVDADSGYYAGETLAELIRAGLDTCIPDSNTAADLHRGQPVGTVRDANRGRVVFLWDPATGGYSCPQGNRLLPSQIRRKHGQRVQVYRAQQPCIACPLASECLTRPRAKHRTLNIGVDAQLLEDARRRFNEPAYQDRYHHRGEAVETVFGFLHGTLGYVRWLLRGDRIPAEGRLIGTAYQVRKVHKAWATA